MILINYFIMVLISILVGRVIKQFDTEKHWFFPLANREDDTEKAAASKMQFWFSVFVGIAALPFAAAIESLLDMEFMQREVLHFISGFTWLEFLLFLVPPTVLWVGWRERRKWPAAPRYAKWVAPIVFLFILLWCVVSYSGLSIPSSFDNLVGDQFNHVEWTLDKNKGLLTIKGTTVAPSRETAFRMEFTAPGTDDKLISIDPPWLKWKDKIIEIRIDNTLVNIGPGAFRGCEKLKKIRIPSSIERIESEAFYNCKRLSSVDIPGTQVQIDDKAFYGCRDLHAVSLGSGIRKIGREAFMGCSSLEEFIFPDTVDIIGERLFFECRKLKNVVLPPHLSEIPRETFANCTRLEKVDIPASVLTICESAFQGCTSLQSVTIPDSVREIGQYAFGQCLKLKEIHLPDSVTVVGEYVFQDCENLITADIKSSRILRLESHVFGGCTSLVDVDTPKTLEVIMKDAFSRCSSLRSIYIYGAMVKIEQGAFPDREQGSQIEVHPDKNVSEELIETIRRNHRQSLVVIPPS